MASLYLSDILKRNDLDPSRVMLIRHSLNHKSCIKCYKAGMIDEYQKIQKQGFFDKFDYILSFISEPGTSAKFYGCYTVGEGTLADEAKMIPGFPSPEMIVENDYYYDLKKSELLSDLENRLVIDWGRSTVSWHQKATNEKEVLAIQENPKTVFCGYENVLLSYADLAKIIKDRTLHENWHTALESVYAIYLIVDSSNGKQYVGSAYGEGGLLGRWKCYVDTKHGGNEGMKEVICNHPDRYAKFLFSILQILPKTVTDEGVIKIETLYKNKLLTKEFGMNEN